jgi:integrase
VGQLAKVTTKKVNLTARQTLSERSKEYGRAATAENSRLAYEADLKSFQAFCADHGEQSLPALPQTVADYFTHLAETGKAVATIKRRAVSVGQSHALAGYENPVKHPVVRKVLQGIKRTHGSAQHKKTALTGEALPTALLAIDTRSLMGKRDKAIILLAFAMAGRRSEVAALNVEDIDFRSTGLVVTLRKSKTDQEGQGRQVGVPHLPHEGLCPVRAVEGWIAASGITHGPLFRVFALAGKGQEQKLSEKQIDGRAVAALVKRVTRKAGIKGDFSGHSLRSGFITTAASTKGVTEGDIQAVSGHRSVPQLRSYVQRANVLKDCPLSAMFGGTT